MKKIYYLLSMLFVLGGMQTYAQKEVKKPIKKGSVHPIVEIEAVHFSISKPVRDMEPSKGPRTLEQQKAFKKLKQQKEAKLNFDMEHRFYPNESSAMPLGNDPVWQKQNGYTQARNNRTPLINFSGQNSPYSVSDCNGSVGPNHFMQGVNTTFAIWDKSGNQVVGPTNFNTLFEGVEGAGVNDGDPIIIYDDRADRWLAAEFSGVSTNPDYMLIAISTTNDPTGTWYRWSYEMDGFPDYEKFGVWRDGYYMGTNTGGGTDVYVFERDVMLAGGENPKMLGFANPNRPASGFHCIEPLDNDGVMAPVGTPGIFITINDDAWGGSNDELWIYELNVDWFETSNSTFERTQTIATADFDSNFGSGWDNISQLGVEQKVDAVPQILMYRAQYRNFGSSQTIVCAHAVDVDDSDHAGVRWYELEKTDSEWSIRQQGTYAPDEHSRWMPSISMDANHNIALAYSISSSSMYPGIKYCGQSAAENSNATGIMDISEENVLTGTSSHSSDNRWGDYSEMSIDPVDDATFWFTTEFANGSNSKSTQIVSFQFQPAVVVDVDAAIMNQVSPVSGLDLGASEQLVFSVKNNGNNSISNIPITYQINGGELVTESIAGPIASGEFFNYTFNQTVDLSEEGSYDIKSYVGLSGDLNHTNDTIYRSVHKYGAEYCGATGGNGYEYISRVQFGDIDNTSAASQYTGFTSIATDVEKGQSLEMIVSVGSAYASDQSIVWIDFNQDLVFDEAEKVLTTATSEGPHTGTITIPTDALIGETRMRIRLHDTGGNSNPNSTPCGSSGYGEVEDYTVNILNATGIVTQEKSNFLTLTPNPASKKVVIESREGISGKIQIVDVTGRVIYSEDVDGFYNTTIDFSEKANGVYIVKYSKDSEIVENIKLVISH